MWQGMQRPTLCNFMLHSWFFLWYLIKLSQFEDFHFHYLGISIFTPVGNVVLPSLCLWMLSSWPSHLPSVVFNITFTICLICNFHQCNTFEYCHQIEDTWSCHLSATSCKASIPPLARRGNLMWIEALIAVPRLVGQKVSHPSLSSEVKDMRESMCSIPSISSWNTRPTSPPGAMEMMRRWSSSPTQTKNVFSSLWKMPRPVGQYLLAFAACTHAWMLFEITLTYL